MSRTIRQIASDDKKSVYLTFDDGPDTYWTNAVLDILERHQIPATFFVIGAKAASEIDLIRRMQKNNCTIGNHSLTHQYRYFFKSRSKLEKWIEEAEVLIQKITGGPSIGFRSPAGVWTPPLIKALANLEIPLIGWNVRFYDTAWRWTEKKASRSAKKMQPGSIILLHDRPSKSKDRSFLKVLDRYISDLKRAGFEFKALRRD